MNPKPIDANTKRSSGSTNPSPTPPESGVSRPVAELSFLPEHPDLHDMAALTSLNILEHLL